MLALESIATQLRGLFDPVLAHTIESDGEIMPSVRNLAIVGVATATIALSFASCGGGGGGGGGGGAMNPPPTITPASPTPTPSPVVCPSGGCTAFSLSGSISETVTRTAPTPVPPPSTTTSTVSQTIAVITGQVFHGKPATDYQSTEIDTSPNQAITTNTDNYLQFPATTGNIVNIGFHSDDSNGVDLDVQYPSGNGITGEVPLTPVSPGWSNTASTILAETSPDGTSINETINADGSYNLTESAVAGSTTATQNSDSTGTAIVPVIGFFGQGIGTATQITIPLQSAGTINYTLNAVGAVVAPIIIPVAAWYPVSPTLASDTTTNLGTKSIPAGCVAAGFGTSGIELSQQQSRLDTIFGISDTKVTNTWVTAVGPVCQQIAESMNIYYDFTGQSGGPASRWAHAHPDQLDQRAHRIEHRRARRRAHSFGRWPSGAGVTCGAERACAGSHRALAAGHPEATDP